MTERMSLGQFISFRRESLGYKKMEFSQLMGVGDDTLRSWERNKFIPAGKNKRRLFELLGFSAEEKEYYFGGKAHV